MYIIRFKEVSIWVDVELAFSFPKHLFGLQVVYSLWSWVHFPVNA